MLAHESGIRRSIEVEYWVVDSEGYLTDPTQLVEAAPGVEREFVEPLLEIKTTPCESTAELREQLFTRIRAVLDRASDEGLGLVPLSTPINADDIADLPSERTRMQDQAVGSDFEYVRHCAGTHIHVEQQPGRKVDQLNTLIALDPALALVNSSPYFRGRKLAASARSKLYRWMAYDSLPGQGQLWPYVDDPADWRERLRERYDQFVTAAVEAGVDRERVAATFDPESAVWTPVQLRAEFSTVEWRSPDTALPSQVVRLADDIAGVVASLSDRPLRIEGRTGRVTEDTIVLPEFHAVEGYAETAIQQGLSSETVQDYLDRMGFDVAQYQPLVTELEQTGVTPAEARELRLDYAERLEHDVRQASPVAAE